jgi:AraC-like DNA-binding protein
MQTIPRSVFDTRDLPAADRYDDWHDSFSVLFDYTAPAELRQQGFFARADNALVGPMVLTDFASTAAHYDRDAAWIARDSVDVLMLQFGFEGPCRILTAGREQQCAPGDVFIMDMAQPVRTYHDTMRSLTLTVPRHLVAAQVPQLEDAHLAVLKAHTPVAQLLRAHVQTLHAMTADLTLAQADSLVAPTVALAAAAVVARLGDTPVHQDHALGLSLRMRADRVIARLLSQHELSVEQIAAAVPCSRSRLQALYQKEGGVMHFVQRQRLRAVARHLRAPTQRHRTIGAIAYDLGFMNPSSFTRAFRAEFGLSPRAVRAHAMSAHRVRQDASQANRTNPSRNYESWFRAL